MSARSQRRVYDLRYLVPWTESGRRFSRTSGYNAPSSYAFVPSKHGDPPGMALNFDASFYKVFGEKPFVQVRNELRTGMIAEIRAEDANYLLNANEDDLVEHYVSKNTFTPITIHWDQQVVTDRESQIRAELFPSNFNVTRGQSYPKQVVKFLVPFSGDEALLKYQPSGSGYEVEANIYGDSLGFNIINFYDNPENVKVQSERMFKKAMDLCDCLRLEVEQFNTTFPKEIREAIQKRKAEHLKRANMLAALGVPLQKSSNTPETFSVPKVKRKIVVKKPAAPETAFAPEPVLDDAVYEDILKIFYEMGVEMERHPAVYQDKPEEALRDHFVMFLSPHFESVTGETFNGEGKSDILIRHEKSNLFVAECKFWGGKVEYHKAIDQLFRYLTWRDSKAAVVLFVDSKELSTVLKTIEDETPNHPTFVKAQGKRNAGWFMYDLHLPGDSNRHVKVAVLVFHFPKIERPTRATKPKQRTESRGRQKEKPEAFSLRVWG